MPDSKGELKRYSEEQVEEMAKGMCESCNKEMEVFEWDELPDKSKNYLRCCARYALSTAEQRIEELEKQLADREVIESSLKDTPMTESPGKDCGWSQEGFDILMGAEPDCRMEFHVGSIQKLYRHASKAEATMAEIRGDRENTLRKFVDFLGLQHTPNGSGWDEVLWYPDGRTKALAAFLAQKEGK